MVKWQINCNMTYERLCWWDKVINQNYKDKNSKITTKQTIIYNNIDKINRKWKEIYVTNCLMPTKKKVKY